MTLRKAPQGSLLPRAKKVHVCARMLDIRWEMVVVDVYTATAAPPSTSTQAASVSISLVRLAMMKYCWIVVVNDAQDRVEVA